MLEGKTRITEARLGQALGPYQVHGANITIDMTPTAAEARADMLINGVVAKAIWQHVFAAPPEKQPPLKITATLDNSYRTQLGLDINDLVQGDVGIEATISTDARSERRIHVRADLVNAEVGLDSVAWRKPRGKRSVFEFDVGKGTGAYPIELLNVKLVGDDVAIEGWMGIGSDNKVKEFRFPNFSLNVITSLETHGKVRPDGVWDVTAKGPTYDGRELFRSFFDVAHQVDPNAKIRPGLDLKAEITTVVGFTDTTLRNVKMTLQKRSNKLTGLDVRGTLDGGKAFAAVVRQEPGRPRTLIAESQDAGQVFKLVGFYPNAVGGDDEPRGQPRGRGRGGAHRHAVGAQLPGARRSRGHRGAAERGQQPQRAAQRRAPAVRLRDHARAVLGRPRPVRHAQRRHQRPVRGREPARQGRFQGAASSTSAAPTWAAPASCR